MPARPTASVIQLHWKIGRSTPSAMPTTSSRQRRRRSSSARLGTSSGREHAGDVLTCGRGAAPSSASSSAATSSSRDSCEQRLDERAAHGVLGARARAVAVEQRPKRDAGAPRARARSRRAEQRRASRPPRGPRRSRGAPRAPRAARPRDGRPRGRARAPSGRAPRAARSSGASASRVCSSTTSRARKTVEPRRLAGRNLGGQRRHRAGRRTGRQSSRSKSNGPGGDRAGRRQPKRADGPAELAGASGTRQAVAVELALELEDERPVDLATEVARQQTSGVRPGGGQLVRGGGPHAHASAELDRARRRSGRRAAPERSVRAAVAEERALELGVGALEGRVVPVEAAAGLRRARRAAG